MLLLPEPTFLTFDESATLYPLELNSVDYYLSNCKPLPLNLFNLLTNFYPGGGAIKLIFKPFYVQQCAFAAHLT